MDDLIKKFKSKTFQSIKKLTPIKDRYKQK